MIGLRRNNIKNLFIFLFILSFFLQKLSIDLGFHLKPFMIFILFSTPYVVLHIRPIKLEKFDILLVLFFVYYMSTIFIKASKETNLRFIIGILFMLHTYFITRYLLSVIEISDFERILSNVGILFNVISLFLYLIGLLIFINEGQDV